MAEPSQVLESLTAEERIALMGCLSARRAQLVGTVVPGLALPAQPPEPGARGVADASATSHAPSGREIVEGLSYSSDR